MYIYHGIDYSNVIDNSSFDENLAHSMGMSLKKYIDIKLPDFIASDIIEKIYILGKYNRDSIIFNGEKMDKEFNFERPTYRIDGEKLFVYCYPGVDYVYHYYCMIKTYLNILNTTKKIITIYPNEEIIRNEIKNSNLKFIPKVPTVIMGYVNGLEYLSSDTSWEGNKDFMWKRVNNDKILLGCKHSYWGDISYYITEYLASLGVKRVIYSGKLGTSNKNYIPNVTLATGNKSIFRDGSVIEWNNLFDGIYDYNLNYGVHATLPSIFDETRDWVSKNKENVDFVDPEIGFIAKSSLDNNIEFSYLHIISDNLSKKFSEDLSNERKENIIIKRKKLIHQIGNHINKL